MISLLLCVIFPSLGVDPYKARQIASRMVDFPAPVEPVMAKMPSEMNSGAVKSISHSP